MALHRPRPDRERLADLCLALTAIPSPTGAERPLAEWVVGRLAASGVAADLQVFADRRANVVARRAGSGGGASLLLYGSLDTAFPLAAEATPGAPGIGDAQALSEGAVRSGDWIIGAGAENPKGFAATVLTAFELLSDPRLPLRGDVILALTAGGMPSPGLPGRPETAGLGRGCLEFLARNAHPDAAVIAKPGDAVSVEEVGLALFRIRVAGDLSYTGIRHRGPVRHALLEAARLAERLEAWFPTYTATRRTATLAPQGAVTVIRGGWPERPVFLPSACDLWVDLRVVPGSTLDEVQAVFTAAVEEAARDLDADVSVERMGGFPGAATPRESWVVRAAVRAWEARTGRRHAEATGTSGVTDASILRANGVPTARIGMPRPAVPSPHAGFSMGVVHVDAMVALTQTLVDIAVDTLSRPRAEIVAGEPAGPAA